jgi:hypothetical protein
LAFGCYVENIQVGHGDRSHGHDGLPVFGAKSYNEGYDSLTTNRPLLLLRMTERKKRMERWKKNNERNKLWDGQERRKEGTLHYTTQHKAGRKQKLHVAAKEGGPKAEAIENKKEASLPLEE